MNSEMVIFVSHFSEKRKEVIGEFLKILFKPVEEFSYKNAGIRVRLLYKSSHNIYFQLFTNIYSLKLRVL